MTCKRCGQCCISAQVTLTGVTPENDPQEMARFFSYHGCVAGIMPDGDLGIKIPTLCCYLGFEEDGTATCSIYEQRPAICRNHLCRRANAD